VVAVVTVVKHGTPVIYGWVLIYMLLSVVAIDSVDDDLTVNRRCFWRISRHRNPEVYFWRNLKIHFSIWAVMLRKWQIRVNLHKAKKKFPFLIATFCDCK
jgi:hypothetical protein